MIYLDLEDNLLAGSLPASWSMNKLQYVSFASNSFNGSVPGAWSNWTQVSTALAELLNVPVMYQLVTTAVACMQGLSYASFASNELSGSIPTMYGSTLALNMTSNKLTMPTFSNLPAGLQFLGLGNNNLTGTFPSINHLPNLTWLDLSHNHFLGSLPNTLPQHLSVLNASYNSFNQALPESWSKLQNLTELRLDGNEFTGELPAEWSAWGKNTDNSMQLSVTNASLHGHMPQQWVQQFCLATEKSTAARVLFQPKIVQVYGQLISLGALLELPAQHASINVSLSDKLYTFDCNNPASICSIPGAARNTGLLWGTFAALVLMTVICSDLWVRRKRDSASAVAFAKLAAAVMSLLSHDKLRMPQWLATKVWFVAFDIAQPIYSLLTDAITIHQVFESRQLKYAYMLLAFLLLPFAFMITPIAILCINMCQHRINGDTSLHKFAALLVGLVLSPVLYLVVAIGTVLQGVSVPLPSWVESLDVNMFTFYRLLSLAESSINALPQSILQSQLYVMGNDPNGIHVYINTRLFLFSITGSFFSILKSIAVIIMEPYQNQCSLVGYCSRLGKLESMEEYHFFPTAQVAGQTARSSAVQLLDHRLETDTCRDTAET